MSVPAVTRCFIPAAAGAVSELESGESSKVTNLSLTGRPRPVPIGRCVAVGRIVVEPGSHEFLQAEQALKSSAFEMGCQAILNDRDRRREIRPP